MANLEQTMYDALKGGMTQEEILRMIVDTKRKIADEQTKSDEIMMARGEFVDSLLEYLRVLGLEEFFEKASELDEDNTDVDEMMDNFWEAMHDSLIQKEKLFTKMFKLDAVDLDTLTRQAKTLASFF